MRRWCSGFEETVVIASKFSAGRVRRALPSDVRLVVCPDYPDDYLGQQVSKLYADWVTSAGLICHLDSDMEFVRPTVPADLVTAGRVRVHCRSTDELGRHRPWVAPTEAFLQRPVELDFMQQPPFTFPRFLYGAVRRHCEATHGVPLDRYVTSRDPRGFSEFNVLGAYAHQYHRERFSFVAPGEPRLCRWHWSRDSIDSARIK